MARMNCFLINGVDGSGKDTFINFCKHYSPSNNLVFSILSISEIKEAALLLGWTGDKDEKSRKLLSDLEDLFIEYNDFPRKYMMNKLKLYYESMKFYELSKKNYTLFFQIRKPKEIDTFKNDIMSLNKSDIIVKTLLIDADNRIDNINSNHADRDVKNYEYDITISNNGSIETFKYVAKKFIEFFAANEYDNLINQQAKSYNNIWLWL